MKKETKQLISEYLKNSDKMNNTHRSNVTHNIFRTMYINDEELMKELDNDFINFLDEEPKIYKDYFMINLLIKCNMINSIKKIIDNDPINFFKKWEESELKSDSLLNNVRHFEGNLSSFIYDLINNTGDVFFSIEMIDLLYNHQKSITIDNENNINFVEIFIDMIYSDNEIHYNKEHYEILSILRKGIVLENYKKKSKSIKATHLNNFMDAVIHQTLNKKDIFEQIKN